MLNELVESLLSGQSWGAHKVVGVDIDDTLIRAAWRKRRTVWSLQEPEDGDANTTSMKASSANSNKRKRESSSASHLHSHPQPDYFPMSCEHEIGSLPIPPSEVRGRHVFPHNVSFRTADWVSTRIPEDTEGYDVVIAYVWFPPCLLILCIMNEPVAAA